MWSNPHPAPLRFLHGVRGTLRVLSVETLAQFIPRPTDGYVMEAISNDVRIAWRGFRRTPSFLIAVVAVLAISIGSAVAMFTTTRAVLLEQLPVMQPDKLAVLESYRIPTVEVSPPATTLRQMRGQLTTVVDMAGVAHWGTMQSPYVDGAVTRILSHSDVTANYFSVLGTHAYMGRLFSDADEHYGAAPPMVLSYSAWRTKFGADPRIVGRQLMYPYTRLMYTVIGVAPPGLDYPSGVECWTPMAVTDQRNTLALVRLKDGATLHAAASEYFRQASQLLPQYELKGASGKLLMDVVVGETRPALMTLSAAVLLLLIIACVNIANMFLLRAAQRTRELALRRVLGASHRVIVRQLLVESALLAVTGGACGGLLALGMLRALVSFAPTQLPRLDALHVDGGVFGIAVAVTALSVIVFAVAPAVIAASASHEQALRSGSRSTTQTRVRKRLRDGLVVSQVALALTLLITAGLVSRSLLLLQNESLGYEPAHLAIASFAWDVSKSGTPEKILAMGRDMQRELRELPGVEGVTPIVIPPFYGISVWHGSLEAELEPGEAAKPPMDVPIEIGGAGYFETMQIPVTRGRGFRESDDAGGERVAVVSQSVATHFWPNGDAVGQRIRSGPSPTQAEPWYRVIGVVPDTRFRMLRATSPMIYRSWQQEQGWQGAFAIRSTIAAAQITKAIGAAARKVDPTLVLGDLRSMDEALSVPLSAPRSMALVLSAFGTIAVFLAAIGLYGVLSSSVREQTREIGIRSALGATPGLLVLSVVRHAFIVAAIGAAAGLFVAFGVTRFIASLLYETSPTDAITLFSVVTTLLLIAAISAWAPARYAARVQPMTALRAE